MTKTKVCTRCKQRKSLSEFYKQQVQKDKKASYCKKCAANFKREFIKKNPIRCREIRRKSCLKIRYGLAVEDWQQMFDEQQGCCAICGIHQSELKKPLSVDHNHGTDQIRGLLCCNCNTAIGSLGADCGTDLLQKAIKYVEKYK